MACWFKYFLVPEVIKLFTAAGLDWRKVEFLADNGSYWAANGMGSVLLRTLLPEGMDIIYLPPRCPYLNPIEPIFGLLKRDVRGGSSWSTATLPVSSILAGVDRLTAESVRNTIDRLWGPRAAEIPVPYLCSAADW